jgi:hypothetical protein
MQNQKNPTLRSSTETTWFRALQLVALVDADPGRYPRAYFADRWRMTPRSVSNIVAILKRQARVKLAIDPGGGYRIADPGILNLRRLGVFR